MPGHGHLKDGYTAANPQLPPPDVTYAGQHHIGIIFLLALDFAHCKKETVEYVSLLRYSTM
jgi:hypothetical protein